MEKLVALEVVEVGSVSHLEGLHLESQAVVQRLEVVEVGLANHQEVLRLARAVDLAHRQVEALESQAVVLHLARAVEASVHRHLEALESQAVVLHLARVVEASVHRQVDLEAIKEVLRHQEEEEVSR